MNSRRPKFDCCVSLSGEAQGVLAKAEAKSKAIRVLSEALSQQVKDRCCFLMSWNTVKDFCVRSDHFYHALCRMETPQPL